MTVQKSVKFTSMKTTLDLNGKLLADAKVLAARQRTSLTRLIEEGLQLRLRVASARPVAKATRIPVHRGKGGLVRGVDPLRECEKIEKSRNGLNLTATCIYGISECPRIDLFASGKG